MEIIKTKSFELAIYAKGNPNSQKLAIVLPGRLDTKDYFHLTSLVDYLSTKDYFALSFDPAGTWESPGSIGLYTNSNTINSVEELIEYFGNKPTLLAGHSRGGTIAMLVGPKNQYVTHFISIFSHYGPSGYPDKNKIIEGKVASYRDLPPGKTRTKERKRFDLPIQYFKESEKYNALAGLKNSNKPKLFFYGTKDNLVSKEGVKKAYNESSSPKEIQEINSEHDYRLHPEIVEEVNNKIGEFLDKHS